MASKQAMYKVEKIIGKRPNPKKKGLIFVYLVKWEGWEEKDSTWEPRKHLENVKDLIEKYERQNNTTQNKRDDIQSLSSLYMISQKSICTDRQTQKKTLRSQSLAPILSKDNLRSQTMPSEVAEKKQQNLSRQKNQKDKPRQAAGQDPLKQADNKSNKTQSDSKDKKNPKHVSKNNKQAKRVKGSQNKMDIKILGMKKQSNGFWYYIVQPNNKQLWVKRDYMINNYPEQLCQFYQQRIVFSA